MALKRFIAYRWIINSIIFPYHYKRLKRRLKLSNRAEIVNMWYKFKCLWFADYWFGRKLIRLIEDKII